MDTDEVIGLVDSLQSRSHEDASKEADEAELGQSCYLTMKNSAILTSCHVQHV